MRLWSSCSSSVWYALGLNLKSVWASSTVSLGRFSWLFLCAIFCFRASRFFLKRLSFSLTFFYLLFSYHRVARLDEFAEHFHGSEFYGGFRPGAVDHLRQPCDLIVDDGDVLLPLLLWVYNELARAEPHGYREF